MKPSSGPPLSLPTSVLPLPGPDWPPEEDEESWLLPLLSVSPDDEPEDELELIFGQKQKKNLLIGLQ